MKPYVWFLLAGSLAIPWILLKFVFGQPHSPYLVSSITGIAIVGSAFLLTWASEAAEKDIPQSLSLTVLALVAVLPEYAVDLYLAWQAGKDPSYISYATANMTGGNRLIIGLGWTLVAGLFFLKTRKKTFEIDSSQRLTFSFLALATLYSFVIPLKGTLTLVDTFIFVGMFLAFVFMVSRRPVEEPELVGPAQWLGELPKIPRRLTTLFLFLYSAFSILISAEPFSEGLISAGKQLNIEEFLLIQWIAPIASESPEIIIAVLFVLKGKATKGMGALISSKVNQWTLLIGMLPLAYCISSGAVNPMHLDHRQVEEIFLTSAQSAFAVATIANFQMSMAEAGLLFGLFVVQLFIPYPSARIFFAWMYLTLCGYIFLKDRSKLGMVFKFR